MIKEKSKNWLTRLEDRTPKTEPGRDRIPIDKDGQALWESICLGVEKFVGSDTSARFKTIVYKAIGDAIAYKANQRRKTITLKDMNRVAYLVKAQGITI